MNSTRIALAILVIGLIGASIFAFVQTQNLNELQTDSTDSVAQLEQSGTESADNASVNATQAADSANAAASQAAQQLDDAAATSTQAADNAIATGTRIALVNGADQRRLQATHTQSAQELDDANATSTQAANYADATAQRLSDNAATEDTIGTDTADNLATQYVELTVAAIVYSQSEATLQAQSASVYSTAQVSGVIGDGVLGESAALPDGFTLFRGTGYEIALPESYDGGDLPTNPRSFYALLDNLGLSETGNYLREQNEDYWFFGIDTNLVNSIPRGTVSIIREEPLIAGMTLVDYLGQSYFDLSGDFALITVDVLFINGQPTGRAVLDQHFDTGSIRQLQYVFLADGTFYVVTFSAPTSEFGSQRPAFETSAATFRLR